MLFCSYFCLLGLWMLTLRWVKAELITAMNQLVPVLGFCIPFFLRLCERVPQMRWFKQKQPSFHTAWSHECKPGCGEPPAWSAFWPAVCCPLSLKLHSSIPEHHLRYKRETMTFSLRQASPQPMGKKSHYTAAWLFGTHRAAGQQKNKTVQEQPGPPCPTKKTNNCHLLHHSGIPHLPCRIACSHHLHGPDTITH